MNPLNTLPAQTVVKLKQSVLAVFPFGTTIFSEDEDTVIITAQIGEVYTAVVREEGGTTIFINGAKVTDYEIMEEE